MRGDHPELLGILDAPWDAQTEAEWWSVWRPPLTYEAWLLYRPQPAILAAEVPAPVPEPATAALLGAALLVVAARKSVQSALFLLRRRTQDPIIPP